MSQLKDVNRRSGVMMVPVDEQFALIDTTASRVLMINPAAAWVWTHLGTPCDIPAEHTARVEAFVNALDDRGLTAPVPAATLAPAGALNDEPLILSQTPLQVAADNSTPMADPFLSV